MLVSIKTDFWCLNSLFGEYRKSNRGRSEPDMVVSTDVSLIELLDEEITKSVRNCSPKI